MHWHRGGCHCGAVAFEVQAPDEVELVDCNCSMCAKKGFLHLIVAPAQFELVSGADELSTYRFNTMTAKHMFCKYCGIHPFYVPRSDPDKISVNARCLDDIDGPGLKPTRFFDGRHWEDAQRRRIAESGDVLPADAHGAKTLQAILNHAPE